MMTEPDKSGKIDKTIQALEQSIKRLDQQSENEFQAIIGDTAAYRVTEEGAYPKIADKKLRNQLQ